MKSSHDKEKKNQISLLERIFLWTYQFFLCKRLSKKFLEPTNLCMQE